jgi:hypothetical protein
MSDILHLMLYWVSSKVFFSDVMIRIPRQLSEVTFRFYIITCVVTRHGV